MPVVEIYTLEKCPFCIKAKHLLDARSIPYTEIKVDNNPVLRREMEQRSGRHTVPQVFIDGKGYGGCDDLHRLDEAGELKQLFNQA